MNGNEIRQARERAGLTQGELGERVGVSGRTVGNWERDFSIPRNKLAKVEQVLNVREYLGKESKLQDVSDASLLAEIARRFDEGRTREKAGEGNADSSPSMNQAGGKPATMTVSAIVTLDEVGVSRQERTKTASPERVLYLPRFATEALRKHRKKALDDLDDSPVFPNEAGGWWDTSGIRRRFREVRKLAELDWVSPKTIRKTVATAVYNSDSLDNASQQLGHSEVGVTAKHYVQRLNIGPAGVVGVLDEWLQSAS